MIKKVELETAKHHAVFANPAPLGLLGLAIACAALTPIAFGYGLTPAGFKTAAVFSLLFGAGCQMLAGLMDFANKNTFGGTIFTAFSFSWMVTAWAFYSLSAGFMPDPSVVFATEVALFVIFSILTYGFGYFSSMLFYFLLDIDLLYLCKIIQHVLGMPTLLSLPIAFFTVGMGLIAFWMAMAALINPTAGREIFKMTGPVFFAPKKSRFDFTLRFNIFEALYEHWKKNAFKEMRLEELQAIMKTRVGDCDIVPELFYLWEYGCLVLNFDVFDPNSKDKIASLRLNSGGLDLYEQLILKKYDWS